MIPRDPELIDRLASEYVLGTLRGPARRCFERWRAASAGIDARCRFWEEQLLPLARNLKPLRPPAHLWEGIDARLQLTPARRSARAPMRTWLRALAASLVVAAGLAALYQAGKPGPITQQARLAVSSGAAAWTVEVHAAGLAGAQLVVRTASLERPQPGHDYELWALPAGGKPVSLGVLPAGGELRHALSASQRRALARSRQLAVSLEPAGGSPTGQPTGPVVATAPLSAVS